MDQLTYVPVETVYPYAMIADSDTAALRQAMTSYAASFTQASCAVAISTPERRQRVLDALASSAWHLTDKAGALAGAELAVWAIEAVAGGYSPEQCQVAFPVINGQRVRSFVVSMEGLSV